MTRKAWHPEPGQRFGGLVAVRFAGVDKHRQHRFVYRCDCGQEVVRTVSSTKKDRHHHCGCLTSELNRSKTPLLDRIARRLRKADSGCIEWIGSLHQGYGYLGEHIIHRVMYEAAKGPIPEGLTIDHLCMNKACCNPEHLEPVTKSENSLRMLRHYRKDVCAHGHEWTPENTYRHGIKRYCKACRARGLREMRARQAEAKRATA